MGTYERPVTPAHLSEPIISLCREINGVAAPSWIDVRPLPDAPADECFFLVPEHVKRFGGTAVNGWAIWEWPTLFVEAEFHCVWRSPEGQLIDITPKKTPTSRILFLADETHRYAGRQVNNVRRPVRRLPAVVAFLAAADAEYELTNRGERAGYHGEVRLEGVEAEEYHRIQMQKAACVIQFLALKPSIGPYDPCLCGSGKKAKWCHAG